MALQSLQVLVLVQVQVQVLVQRRVLVQERPQVQKLQCWLHLALALAVHRAVLVLHRSWLVHLPQLALRSALQPLAHLPLAWKPWAHWPQLHSALQPLEHLLVSVKP